MSFGDQVQADLQRRIAAANRRLDAVGQAWARAIAEEAPKGPTGLLKGSVTWHPTATGGYVSLVWYGEVVNVGLPGSSVPSVPWGTLTLPALSDDPVNVQRRAAYAAARGRVITHPNPFVRRAWERADVQAAAQAWLESL